MTMEFKAIETKFDGYRFRSRLEARWAVFFKTLGIEYRYEPEGYILEGTPYLPDFFLPQHNHFIEIKGQAPTEDEIQKAKKLALYTNKLTYIIHGSIGFPNDEYAHTIQLLVPPALYAYTRDPQEQEEQEAPREINTSREVLAILQKLSEVGLGILSEDDGDGWYLAIEQYMGSPELRNIQSFAGQLLKQHEVLLYLAPLLKQYENDLHEALAVGDNEYPIFHAQLDIDPLVWLECNACGDIRIGSGDHTFEHRNCSHDKHGTYIPNSPRLIEAYTAARQARFEREAKS